MTLASKLGVGVVLAGLGLGLALAPMASAQVFSPTTAKLPNGLQIIVVENHRAPIVSHMVWYKTGAADETPGKSGIAHLLEHMMFKGTPSVAAGDFSKIVARNGGRDNAFTASDYTAYYQNIAADRLEMVMRMEADRMRNLAFDERNFVTERDVVLEERRSRTDNNPAALLAERMDAALFVNHPYHRPVIGWPGEVAALSRDDAMAFYRRWYAPNNAILVVSGDVDPQQVITLAQKYYGPLKPEDTPQRKRLEEPPPVGERRITLEDARVQDPGWTRLYLAPSYANTQDTSAPYALQVLEEILGGGATSRLYASLAVGQGLAAAVTVSYEPAALDLSTVMVQMSPQPGQSLDKLEHALDAEIDKLLAHGVTQAELDRAKVRLIANVTYARDSLHTAAQVFGQALTTGQQVADVEAWPQRIAQVTVDQVNAAARAVLTRKISVTGVLLPVPGAVAAPAAMAPPISKEVR